jgi:hypothetical protein
MQQCKYKLSTSSPARTNLKWVESATKQQQLTFITLSTAKHWQKNSGIDGWYIATNALLAIREMNQKLSAKI